MTPEAICGEIPEHLKVLRCPKCCDRKSKKYFACGHEPFCTPEDLERQRRSSKRSSRMSSATKSSDKAARVKEIWNEGVRDKQGMKPEENEEPQEDSREKSRKDQVTAAKEHAANTARFVAYVAGEAVSKDVARCIPMMPEIVGAVANMSRRNVKALLRNFGMPARRPYAPERKMTVLSLRVALVEHLCALRLMSKWRRTQAIFLSPLGLVVYAVISDRLRTGMIGPLGGPVGAFLIIVQLLVTADTASNFVSWMTHKHWDSRAIQETLRDFMSDDMFVVGSQDRVAYDSAVDECKSRTKIECEPIEIDRRRMKRKAPKSTSKCRWRQSRRKDDAGACVVSYELKGRLQPEKRRAGYDYWPVTEPPSVMRKAPTVRV
jgi:hypothetical protein